jgi:hypothetical protein
LTIREDPGGEPPSAATSAQAVGAGRVQELRAARQQALAYVQELSTRLAREQAHAKKLSRSYEQAVRRNVAKVKELARQTSWVTPTQYDQLDEELRRERSLARELDRVRTQVQARTQALARAEAQAQELERALALAMAQARTLARARTPRYRIAAFLRLLWQLRSPQRMWGGVVRNLVLGMGIVKLAVWMLPTADRDRWKDESFSELEDLKREGKPLLGDAIRIASRTPWLALVLWTGAWRRSPAARWLPRLKPLWIGVGTAAATFLGGIAGIGQHPTEYQMRALIAASLLTGAVALTGSFKGRRPRRRSRRGRKR